MRSSVYLLVLLICSFVRLVGYVFVSLFVRACVCVCLLGGLIGWLVVRAFDSLLVKSIGWMVVWLFVCVAACLCVCVLCVLVCAFSWLFVYVYR